MFKIKNFFYAKGPLIIGGFGIVLLIFMFMNIIIIGLNEPIKIKSKTKIEPILMIEIDGTKIDTTYIYMEKK